MNYFLYYSRSDCFYYLESVDWHERFSHALPVFTWLMNHLGPGDSLHWVEDE